MHRVLWLPSWYPNKLDEFDGDFIKRHADAVALFCKVRVIYLKKDVDLPPHKVLIDISESGNKTEQIVYYNSPQTGIEILNKILAHRRYLKLYKKIVSEYISENDKPNLVHVHVTMKAGLIALWLKKKYALNYVITEHWTGYFKESKPNIYNYGWFYKKLSKKILSGAQLLLPVSRNLGETINHNFANVPFDVVSNVVDTAFFFCKPLTPTRFRFIHVSHMGYQKNPEGILAAARLLKIAGNDFDLYMLGNDEKRLRSITQSDLLLKDTVQFIPSVNYSGVAREMQAASALVMFSRFENLPCVILEALCCGLPVVSSDVGGISELINEENGILVDHENIMQLAEAMKQVMEKYPYFNREIISTAARKKFNYDTVGTQYLDIYQAVLNNGIAVKDVS